LTRQRKEALAEALSNRFGETLSIDIAIGEAVDETPMQEKSRLADERIEAAKATLEADPNVKALKDMFGAEINADSIELLNPTQND
jgi:DNA polymerase-3 subunit gamma/tau